MEEDTKNVCQQVIDSFLDPELKVVLPITKYFDLDDPDSMQIKRPAKCIFVPTEDLMREIIKSIAMSKSVGMSKPTFFRKFGF